MLSVLAPALTSFQGPTLMPSRSSGVSMRELGEVGVTAPLGVWDPLKLLEIDEKLTKADYRKYVEVEIKHGRIAMLATVGVITTEAGFRWPGYLSKSQNLKFADMPGEHEHPDRRDGCAAHAAQNRTAG
jgi:light-harvesting complex I chlorophyll a/b binding protein 1